MEEYLSEDFDLDEVSLSQAKEIINTLEVGFIKALNDLCIMKGKYKEIKIKIVRNPCCCTLPYCDADVVMYGVNGDREEVINKMNIDKGIKALFHRLGEDNDD